MGIPALTRNSGALGRFAYFTVPLAITAMTNKDADLAMKQLGSLKGSEAHSTVILPEEDKNVLRKLGINVTFDPVHQHKKLYHKK